MIGLLEMLLLSSFGFLLAGCAPSGDKGRAAPDDVADDAAAGSTCSAVASVPYWAQKEAITSLKKNIDLFDHVSLFWYHLRPDGEVRKYTKAVEDRGLIERAQERGVKVLALVANLPDDEQPDDGGTWDAERVGRLIGSESARAAHIEDLMALARRLSFDGIHIDYESLPAQYRGDFTQFIKELAHALHAEGKILAVALHAKTSEDDPRESNGSGAQDWEALHRYADQLHFMTYNQHTSETAPGPVASLRWVERVLRYAVETRQVPASKIFVGLPLYAEEWFQRGSGEYEGLDRDMTFAEAQARKRENDGVEAWSSEHESPYIVFHDQQGREHVIWFENRRSSEQKLALMAKVGICNMALWRLGGEDPGFWKLMRSGSRPGSGGARAPLPKKSSMQESGADSTTTTTTTATANEPALRRLWSWGTDRLELAGETYAKMELYSSFGATDPDDQRENWLVFMDSEQTLEITSRLAFESDVRVVLESDGEEERFYSEFPYRGLYGRKLLLRYQTEHFSAFGGKYEPADDIRGHAPIFFGNYSLNLRMDRRVGVGASATFSHAALGSHTLTGHAFHLDTSRLSGELFSGRDRHRMSDGTLARTGRPDSFLLTLNGGSTGDGAGIAYTLGWGRQKNGDTTALDEYDYLAALKGNVPLGQLGSLEPSIDVMTLQNARGEAGNVRNILLGLQFARSALRVGGAYSMRFVDPGAEEATDWDVITEILASYDFGRGMSMEAAYQNIREGDARNNFLGVVLVYMRDWLVS